MCANHRAAIALALAVLLAAGCWRMQDVGQRGVDGGDTETGDTGGLTDPDTGSVGHWVFEEMDSPTTDDLAAVWGTSFENVYAVGKDGLIIHFDGDAWSVVEYAADAHLNLHAIAGASADLIWAAGADRFMLEFDGEQWAQQQTVFDLPEWPGSYRGLCAKSAEEAIAVGDGATITVNDGWGWSFGIDAYLDSDLHAVACGVGTDAFIAGHDHEAFSSSVLIRYTPWNDWETMDHDPSDNMYGIAGDQGGGVWAVGFDDGIGSKLYRLNADNWTVATTSVHELLGLWADTALGVWAVGNTTDDDAIAAIQSWHGSSLQFELEYDGTSRLRGVWGVDESQGRHVFAVGKAGAILHLHWESM
jgi:hypothetical protein